MGLLLAWQLQMLSFVLPLLLGAQPVAVLMYYLIWKLGVEYFNQTLGIA